MPLFSDATQRRNDAETILLHTTQPSRDITQSLMGVSPIPQDQSATAGRHAAVFRCQTIAA